MARLKTQQLLDLDRALSEIPLGQKRHSARPLLEYETQALSWDGAIAAAYAGSGYTTKEIGEYFGVRYSWVSGGLKCRWVINRILNAKV